MVKQIVMPASVRDYLEGKERIGETIDGFKILELKGGGKTAVTYKVEDEDGFVWALKLVTSKSYGDRAPFREISRFSKASDERFLVFPKGVGDWTLRLGGRTHKFIWFKSRFVDGITLRKFLSSTDSEYSIEEEVKRYIEHIAAALEELRRLGFSHGDLHDGNIMREVVGADGPLPEVKYVVIDFSEAHPVESTREGLSNDIQRFGQHLRTFSSAAYSREVLTRGDQKVLDAIKHIPGLLDGFSPEVMAISSASEVLKRFQSALQPTEVAPRKLDDPFNPLSADNIANDALLADLCFTKMWWTEKLTKNSNVLLVGPRGCGKTMIFRRLRLKTKFSAKKKAEIKSDGYVGFYLPCESLFYMRFSDFSQVDIENNRGALILFFNMAVIAEVASTLSVLPSWLGHANHSTVTAIYSLLLDEAAGALEKTGITSPATSLNEIVSYAESVMRFVRKSLAHAFPVSVQGSTDFVKRLVDVVRESLPSLSNRYFIFFLDDYTEERVPIPLQEALHPIVCQRSPHLCFKVSAHMFSTIYDNPRPLSLDEGRNIEVINLGEAYLKRNRRRAEGKALLTILDERFAHSKGYKGTIEGWLGRTSYPGGRNLGQALHDKDTRAGVRYHGIECLTDLCTGDYSEMIRMVGRIFAEAGIKSNTPCSVISPVKQSQAIESVSREYLSRIRHIRPDGQKLFDIVDAFGNLSKDQLYSHPLVGQGKYRGGKERKDPYDMLTVFVDDFAKAMPVARHTWERLQKASVFIDAGVAPSQRRVIAEKATLRRIYCPAFRTMLTSSEHLRLTRNQFELFMDKPDEFRESRLKGIVSPEQAVLFSKDAVEEGAHVSPEQNLLPAASDRIDLVSRVSGLLGDAMRELPEIHPVHELMERNGEFDLYICAIGFEDRTTSATNALVNSRVKATSAVMFEFDTYYSANERKREEYDPLILALTSGKPQKPINAPIGTPDPLFAERFNSVLRNLPGRQTPKILFDITSCPSLILSESLRILLTYPCDLTILYSEAEDYFPTRDEWESGQVKSIGGKVEGPFSGVRFVSKPPILQADDTGELPVLLVLFPTFNRERTDGVLADLDPDARIWLFGEPHNLTKDAYRIDMAKSFASPIMHPGDPWTQLSTFDYRQITMALFSIYAEKRFKNRIVIMPHGSKLQTVGAGLFAATHQVSMVFAMPKTYDPKRYSSGCTAVWGLQLGSTENLVSTLKGLRALENGNRK